MSPWLRRLFRVEVGESSPYPGNDWLLTLFLLSATIYNAKIAAVRLLLILVFCAVPVILLICRPVAHLAPKTKPMIILSGLWVLYFIIWFSKNFSDFVFDFSGPNVEMMTPVLFLTHLYAIPVLLNYPRERLRVALLRFSLLLVAFLIFEMVLRYFSEPACFLNYNCRFEAKTVGFFSTTNALATSLVVVMLSFFAVSQLRLRSRLTLEFILLTSMARSAIIGYLFGLFVRAFSALRASTRFLLFGGFSVALGVFLFYDPLRLLGDGSANSKIDFFLSAWSLLVAGDPQAIWLGFGANFASVVETLGVRGWSPHAPILKAFMYFGVIGVFLYLSFIGSFLFAFPKSVIPVAAYLLLGLAGAPIFFPTLLVIIAVFRAYEISIDHSTLENAPRVKVWSASP